MVTLSGNRTVNKWSFLDCHNVIKTPIGFNYAKALIIGKHILILSASFWRKKKEPFRLDYESNLTAEFLWQFQQFIVKIIIKKTHVSNLITDKILHLVFIQIEALRRKSERKSKIVKNKKKQEHRIIITWRKHTFLSKKMQKTK